MSEPDPNGDGPLKRAIFTLLGIVGYSAMVTFFWWWLLFGPP